MRKPNSDSLGVLIDDPAQAHNLLSYHLCPNCNYLLQGLEWLRVGKQCTNCGNDGYRRPWPPFHVLEILRSAFYLAKLGDNRERRTVSEAIEASGLPPGIRKQQVDHVVQELRNLRETEDFSPQRMEKELALVKDGLGLSGEENYTAFRGVLQLTECAFEEYKAVVVFACTWVEGLCDELLIEVMAKVKGSYEGVRDLVQSLRTWRQRELVFRTMTGVKPSTALSGEAPAWYRQWDAVKNKRNAIVHGNVLGGDKEDAMQALDVAVKALPVFAKLHNTYAARKPDQDRPAEV